VDASTAGPGRASPIAKARARKRSVSKTSVKKKKY